MSYQIEICANSLQSAINAKKGGADRVELCDNLWEGGTTPSMATIEFARKDLNIGVFVLIRPRGGDFVYTDLEFEIMKRDIQLARQAGVDGIVSGVLNRDGTVDMQRTKELVELSKPLPFTFHRAFDLTPDPTKALEDIIECGAQRILTSGQSKSVESGMNLIKNLLDLARDRIIILPGGGVNEKNIEALYKLGCKEFHFSAKSLMPGLATYHPEIPMNASSHIPKNSLLVSDPKKVSQMKQLLDELL